MATAATLSTVRPLPLTDTNYGNESYQQWVKTGDFPYNRNMASKLQSAVFVGYINALITERNEHGYCDEDVVLAVNYFGKAARSSFFNEFDPQIIADCKSTLRDACSALNYRPPLFLRNITVEK